MHRRCRTCTGETVIEATLAGVAEAIGIATSACAKVSLLTLFAMITVFTVE